MDTKTINVEGIEGDIILRKMNYKEGLMIREHSLYIELTPTGQPKPGKLRPHEMQMYTVILGIKKAPFFSDDIETKSISSDIIRKRIAEIENIPIQCGDDIFMAIQEYNGIKGDPNEQKKK